MKCDWWRSTVDENLYEEVVIKIYVNRLNFISSVHPIGFTCCAFRNKKSLTVLTENHGGSTAVHDTSHAISQTSELQLLPFS